MTLSKRAYAKHRRAAGLQGGSLKAVQRAVETGRITPEPDGRITTETADEQWSARTQPRVFASSPSRRAGRSAGGSKPTPAVITSYFVVLKRLNRLEQAIDACLAEAAELEGADLRPATRWKALYRELKALGHRELPCFQTQLFDLAREAYPDA